jgi:undecaprenyl diphosphate synthase
MNLKTQISPDNLPLHVAIIMDGNGRWAKKRGFLRTMGHEKGVDAVRETVEAAAELGVRYLTLYAFSTENWNRPKYEIDALMKILVKSIRKEMKTLQKNNIRLLTIGDLQTLPAKSRKELENAISETSSNTGLSLVLALSYSARMEILEAAKKIGLGLSEGTIKKEDVTQEMFTSLLMTSDIPDPELLIRTSGEFRVSNFLLWQIAYTELYFTPCLWPDFNREEFYKAILDYQKRERRFGLTSEQIQKLNKRR